MKVADDTSRGTLECVWVNNLGNHIRELIEMKPAEVMSWILGGRIDGLDDDAWFLVHNW